MKTIVIAVLLSTVAAFGAATWVYAPRAPATSTETGSNFDSRQPVADRVAALETALSQEQIARQLLQEEVMFLSAELEGVQQMSATSRDDPREESSESEPETSMAERRSRFSRRRSPEGRKERLVEAGIDVGLADWIVRREEELQMESLQARFEAGRSGDPREFYQEQFSTREVLRQELGDDNYERYLTANGRPISIAVSSVIGSSPAQSAGLMPGDEITRYAGERVFSMTDINDVAMEGEPGQSVVIDILRDGVPMQVAIPRGPLGITGGRSRR